jgi:hypothetical protein
VRTLDTAVLAMLTDPGGLNVHDGEAPVDRQNNVVTADLPYVVYTSDTPVDGPELYSGETTAREMGFDLLSVGIDRNQAKAAAERAEARVRRRSPGAGFGIVRKVDSDRVRRDPTYTTPGGAPLFYVVDRYAVSV